MEILGEEKISHREDIRANKVTTKPHLLIILLPIAMLNILCVYVFSLRLSLI